MKKSLPAACHRRLALVSLGLFALFCLVLAQFYKIQVVEADKWDSLAKAQQQIIVKEPFKRGVFYANTSLRKDHPEEKQALVTDVLKFHLFADPDSIPRPYKEEVAKHIAHYLGSVDVSKVKGNLEKESRSRKIAAWVTQDQRNALFNWWYPYAKKHKIVRNALYTVQDYKRCYPFGHLLGQVLHTLRDERDAETGNSIPTGGLELSLNKYLTGRAGKRRIQHSPRHPLDLGEVIEEPSHGADVYLTIDHHLQAIAEEEVKKAVLRTNAKSGWALMMDVHTGEIWALAQYPFFNVEKVADYFADPRLLEMTGVKAIKDAFEPGSTFKPIVSAVNLEGNKEWSIHDKVSTIKGSIPGVRHVIKDLRAHPYMNLPMAIQKSGNIYFAKMTHASIDKLGAAWFRDSLQQRFGFGKKTGIELVGESSGVLPVPGKINPNGTLQWAKETPYIMSMGHNVQVNGLQMARAFAVFGNGGKLVRPTLVRKIVKGDQVLVDNTKQTEPYPQVVSKQTADLLLSCMRFVTTNEGSAAKGALSGYTEAGKSGTSEKVINGKYSKTVHFSSFIGIAPAKNPRFVLMVAIDEPEHKVIPGIGKMHHGGKCTSVLFRAIAEPALEYLGVEKDDPLDNDWKEETKSLKTLYETWNR